MAQGTVLFQDTVGRQELRRLATRLEAQAGGGSLKSLTPLLVTSCHSKEGKSTVAASLGMLAARELELRTLVVDLDWLTPTQHQIFNTTGSYEVPELLRGDPQSYVKDLGRGWPHLLPAPRAAVELSAAAGGGQSRSWTSVRDFGQADAMGKAAGPGADGRKVLFDHVASLAKNYDLVIIDGPAVFGDPGPVDAIQLASFAKATLVVLAMHATQRDVAKRMIYSLTSAKANVVGVALNDSQSPMAQ